MSGRRCTGRWLLLLAGILCLLLLPASASSAEKDGPAFYLQADSLQASPAEPLHLRLFASPGQQNAGAFRLSLQYDADHFTYLGKEDAAQIQGADLFVRRANPLVTVYTCDLRQGDAPLLSGEIADFVFQPLANAPAGTYPFTYTVDQICDYNGNALSGRTSAPVSVQLTPTSSSASGSAVEKPPEKPVYLSALVPAGAAGTLSPVFQPNIFLYRMNVPADCEEVWFQTEQPVGTAVTVNRHTLQAAGNDTVITVTAADVQGSGKTVYTVIVHRDAEAPAQTSGQVSPAPTAAQITVEVPKGAALSPAFQPAQHQYELTVPADCSQVWLHTQAQGNAAVSVNRHTLQAAGNDTVLTVTLTSLDGAASTDYQVLVHRLAPVSSGSSVSSAKMAPAARTASARRQTSSRAQAAASSKRKVSSKRASSASTRTKKASGGPSAETYVPSGIPLQAKPEAAGLQVAGNGAFTGFQSGVLVVLLLACAATAAILGTRAYYRKKLQNPQPPEDDPPPAPPAR